ncbi:hypothetical protein STM14_2716 [Salmonella enterica subsp. enterica serovar Typhimurium str. 14028S]|uniref:Uncharacterized protein n=1 Tax=Salmonella typhimurium (strain 14028s / SGSC 2262) TaxID=588858 RepID=A0A0F6B3R9_SALT1|nr:hypothetical protein STM14_2716 [Salmonella enterica subsp. enterica serovar Typhimurium str. 14028S]
MKRRAARAASPFLVSAYVYVILCFTYNPWPVMKVSYNRAFVSEG